jgi:hypothetical protein
MQQAKELKKKKKKLLHNFALWILEEKAFP